MKLHESEVARMLCEVQSDGIENSEKGKHTERQR